MKHRVILLVLVTAIILSGLLGSVANADLYIGTFWGGGVYHLTDTGTLINSNGGIGTCSQLAFGPDGNLYVNDTNHNTVTKLNPTTMEDMGDVYNAGSSAMGGMTIGSDGDIYVALAAVNGDWNTRRLVHIAGPTKANAFTELTPAIDNVWPLWNPGTLASASNGDFYIYDYNDYNGSIQHWHGTGVVGYIQQKINPFVGPDDNIYVGANRYQGPSGATPDKLIGQFLDLTGSGMTNPTMLAFNPADSDVYASDGTKLCRFGGPGKTNEGKYVSTIISDLGAAGIGGSRYMVFTPGEFTLSHKKPTAGLYVATWPSSVGQYSPNGVAIQNLGHLYNTSHVTFGPDGDIYALGSNGKGVIARFDGVNGGFKGYVIESIPGDAVYSMAIGPDGDIYVAFRATGNADGSTDWNNRGIKHYAGPNKPNAFQYVDNLVGPTTGYLLGEPNRMTFGPDGHLYIGQANSDKMNIQCWGGPGDPDHLIFEIQNTGSFQPTIGPDNNIYAGVNRYQGTYGNNPGQLIGQFIDLTGSGMTSIAEITFNPVDGDLYAHDNNKIARFAGPGKSNEGHFVSNFASLTDQGWSGACQMVFAPSDITPIEPPTPVNDIIIAGFSAKGTMRIDNNGRQVMVYNTNANCAQIEIGPDGYLYALTSDANPGKTGIERLNLQTGDSQMVWDAGQDLPFGMAFGPDGDIYVAFMGLNGSYDYRKVAHFAGPMKIDAFKEKTPLIAPNTVADPSPNYTTALRQPYYIGFGPDGDLYVNDGPDYGGWGAIRHWGGPSQPNTDKGNFVSPVGYVQPVFGPDGNLYIGVNRYQGPMGQNPGQLIGQFINLAGSPMTSVSFILFDPISGDLFAQDGSTLCRFVGPGKPNEGKFIRVHANLNTLGLGNDARCMIFAPAAETTTAASIDAVKKASNGTAVNLTGQYVTGQFYNEWAESIGFAVEDSNRTSGIRVVWSDSYAYLPILSTGDCVNVEGSVDTVDGERVITATNVVVDSTKPNVKIAALGMTGKNTAGGVYGLQRAVADNALADPVVESMGPNNIGMLMTIWGTVKGAKSTGDFNGYFNVDDGSGLIDGGTMEYGSPVAGIKCRPVMDENTWEITVPANGSYAAVTGIMGVKKINGVNTRYFWTLSYKTY